jgi:HD-GYP domain-containing protein (c-di-GMP phosphodiesterase class II)
MDEVWNEFLKSLDIVITSENFNEDLVKAVYYINEKNELLFINSDLITNIIIDNAKTPVIIGASISIFLIVLILVILTLSLFNLYKHLLFPLDKLYKDISKLEIANSSIESLTASYSRGLSPMVFEIRSVFNKLNSIISLIENINQNSSVPEILNYIYHSFTAFIPYTYIGIALIEDDGNSLRAAYGISDEVLQGLPENLLGKKVSISETSLNHVISTGDPRIINDLEQYTSGKPLKSYNKIILDSGIQSSITLPLKFNNKPIGIIFFSSKYKNIYKKEHAKFLQALANGIAIAFQKNIFIEDLLYSSILALAKLAESRDENTGDHLQRMKIYSRVIAQLLYENDKFTDIVDIAYIENIEKFSPLQDIGKVGIRDKVLLKPGKLSLEEFEEMKQHTIYGGEVLRAADEHLRKNGKSVFVLGIEIAEGHHEKWDGSGYPFGKRGEDIPLSARIVAIADVFDALTSRRPYKEPFTLDDAFKLILDGKDKHFDPSIVDIFIENKSRIIKTYNSFKIYNF